MTTSLDILNISRPVLPCQRSITASTSEPIHVVSTPDPLTINQKRESEPTALPLVRFITDHNPLRQRANYIETVEDLGQCIPIVVQVNGDLNHNDEGILILFGHCG